MDIQANAFQFTLSRLHWADIKGLNDIEISNIRKYCQHSLQSLAFACVDNSKPSMPCIFRHPGFTWFLYIAFNLEEP